MGIPMLEEPRPRNPNRVRPSFDEFTVRAVERGCNLVVYGNARVGKTTFIRRHFPNRRVQCHRPHPNRTDEPFIWETQEDASKLTFWGFTRDVYIVYLRGFSNEDRSPLVFNANNSADEFHF